LIKERERANNVLRVLKEEFEFPEWATLKRDPFQTLVITVISQNTADRNTARAFKNLSSKFDITPESISKADLTEIEEALKVAGLYRNKAKTLKHLASLILERFEGSLNFIYTLPLEEARKILINLPGVGPKTADVVLLFCAKKPTFPVDTHVNRVSKRLGFAPSNAGYEEVRNALQNLFSPEDYLAGHILLISLGRKYCMARKTLCNSCPVKELCPTGKTRSRFAGTS